MLKVILGTKNRTKKTAIELAFKELGITDYEIKSVSVDSVSSKPINEEILIAARNINNELYNYCFNNQIEFDLLISIEEGYESLGDNHHFIVTYASIVDKSNQEYIGKSQGLQISKKMFEWIKEGNSLNKVIERLLRNSDNKKSNGISGYLTDGYYYKSKFDASAVICALQYLEYKKTKYKILDDNINSNIKNKKLIKK